MHDFWVGSSSSNGQKLFSEKSFLICNFSSTDYYYFFFFVTSQTFNFYIYTPIYSNLF